MCGDLLVLLVVSHSYKGEATVRETSSQTITRELHPSQQVMSDNDGTANDSRNLHNPQKGDEVALPEEVESEKSLPAGWEARKTATGHTFYVDHINRRTQWERPTLGNAVESDVEWYKSFFLCKFDIGMPAVHLCHIDVQTNYYNPRWHISMSNLQKNEERNCNYFCVYCNYELIA